MPETGRNTNYPFGVSNVAESVALGGFPAPDPSKVHMWWNDFDTFTHHATNSAEWLSTLVGAGSAALAMEDGGVVLLTCSAADDDSVQIQWKGWGTTVVLENFKFDSAKSMWLKARCKISDATESDLLIGLAITDTTLIASLPTDGLFFYKQDGSTTLNFHARKGGTSTTVAVGTLVTNTYATFGMYYNASSGQATVYFNDVASGQTTTLTNFPNTEEIAASIAVQNGEAVAKNASFDYLFVAKER